MAIITPAEFLTHYPQLTGTGENTRLGNVIAAADSLMALFCGWPADNNGFYTLALVEYTLFPAPRADNYSVIDIPHGAPKEIDAVFIDPTWLDHIADQHPDESEVDVDDVHLDRHTRELWIGSTATPYSQFSTVPRANKIELHAGLTATPTQFDLIAMVAAATRHLLEMPRFGSAAAVTQGGQTFTRTDFDHLLPASVRQSLAPYVWWGSRVG